MLLRRGLGSLTPVCGVAALVLQACGDASSTTPPSASGDGQDAGMVVAPAVDSSSENAPLDAAAEDASRLDASIGDAGEHDAPRGDAEAAESGLGDAEGGEGADAREHDAPGGDAEAGESGLPDAETVDSSDAGNDGTGNIALPAGCVGNGAHSGARWQDLYACYFGPAGIANCSLNSSCHTTGGQAAAIWTCGSTSAQCYSGLFSMLVTDAGVTDPMATLLYFSLRKADGSGGDMPLDPQNAAFTTADLTRIDTWIIGGGKNN